MGVWACEDVVWVFDLVAEWAVIVVLMLPLEKLGAAAKVPGCVFGGASLLGWR